MIACLIVSDISVALLWHAGLLVLSNLMLTLAALHLEGYKSQYSDKESDASGVIRTS